MNEDDPDRSPPDSDDTPHHRRTERYGGGHVESRHGRIDAWLMVVYALLFVWAVYYGVVYWGGLGPGLDY